MQGLTVVREALTLKLLNLVKPVLSSTFGHRILERHKTHLRPALRSLGAVCRESSQQSRECQDGVEA